MRQPTKILLKKHIILWKKYWVLKGLILSNVSEQHEFFFPFSGSSMMHLLIFFWKCESCGISKKNYPLLQQRDPIWNCRTKNSIISTSFWRKKNASSGGGGRRRSKQLNKRPRRSQAKKLVFQFLCFIKRFSVHIVTQLNSDNAIGRKVGKNTRAKNPISNIKVH